MYIDLNYFILNGGTGMTDATFPRNEFRARKVVDRLTQGRIKSMKETPEAVKRLMVELIMLEATQAGELTQNQPVTTFTNDGYSETYAQPLTADTVKGIEMDLVVDYLTDETDDNGTPLLFMGVG